MILQIFGTSRISAVSITIPLFKKYMLDQEPPD